MKNNTLIRAIAVIGAITFAGLVHADLDDGLVAYYPFNNNADDASGNDNHGTEVGGVNYSAGVRGEAANFDGRNDYVLIEHDNSLNITGDYSFSFWVFSDSEIGVQNVLTKGRDCENAYFFRSAGRQFGITYGDSWCDNETVSTTKLETNKWHNVIAVVSNSSDRISYFLDGRLKSRADISSYKTTNTDPLVIGRHFAESDGSGGFEFPFSGKLDEVRIYERALLGSEIRELYNRDVPNTERPQAPVAIISENLGILFPALLLEGTGDHLEVNLELNINKDDEVTWELESFAAANCSSTAIDCVDSSQAASVSLEDLTVQIPLTSYIGNNRFWATLEFAGESHGRLSWKLGEFGIVSDEGGR